MRVLSSSIFVLVMTSVAGANIYDLADISSNQNCQVVKSVQQDGTGLKYTYCEDNIRTEIDQKFLIVETSVRELPEFVTDELAQYRPEVKNWDRIFISFSTENDNLELFGFCNYKSKTCADDLGYTVGSSIGIGATYQDKYDFELKLENGLYSQNLPKNKRTREEIDADRAQGIRRVNQSVRSTLLLEFLANSARQNKLYYWTLGTGIIGITSTEKFGVLDASRQQEWLHDIMNDVNPSLATHINKVDDGQDDAWGVYFITGIGIQKMVSDSISGARTRTYGEVRARVSTLSRHSNLRLELGRETTHPLAGRQRIGSGASVAITVHSGGTLREATIYLKHEVTDRLETKLAFTCSKGALQNFASYNTPNIFDGKNECLYKLSMKYYFY